MAGFTRDVEVNFDSNIEKVLYGYNVNTTSGEVTSSGGVATLATEATFYFKPVFKDGYEIDTYTNVDTTNVEGVYYCSDKAYGTVTFTSKLSGGGAL